MLSQDDSCCGKELCLKGIAGLESMVEGSEGAGFLYMD